MTSQPSETRTVRNIYGVLRTVRSHGTYNYRKKCSFAFKLDVEHSRTYSLYLGCVYNESLICDCDGAEISRPWLFVVVCEHTSIHDDILSRSLQCCMQASNAHRNIFIFVLVCVNGCDLYFFRCFLSVYTQYLWPISPMQCFCRPSITANSIRSALTAS